MQKSIKNQRERGFFTDNSGEEWSEDSSLEYFEGIWNQIHLPAIKASVCLAVIVLLAPISTMLSIITLVILTLFY